MKITKVLWDSCANGVDCERVYETDEDAVLVRYDRSRMLTGEDARQLGIELPAHEGLLRLPRDAWGSA